MALPSVSSPLITRGSSRSGIEIFAPGNLSNVTGGGAAGSAGGAVNTTFFGVCGASAGSGTTTATTCAEAGAGDPDPEQEARRIGRPARARRLLMAVLYTAAP